MKNNRFLLIFLVLLLSACNFTPEEIFLLPTKTPTFTPTLYLSPTLTSTITPTLPTPTFTLTPTLVGEKSPTPIPQVQMTPTPVVLAHFTPDTATPTIQMEGFLSVTVDADVFYGAGDCKPQSIKFLAQVAKPATTAYVVLFARFKSKQTDAVSDWTSITMDNLGTGTFTHELVARELKAQDLFKDAWVEYQLVATNADDQEVGRTAIFTGRLTISSCVPTPTPTVEPTTTAPIP